MNFSATGKPILFAAATAGLLILAYGTLRNTNAQTADNLTPGMLFGPVYAAVGQRVELCASNLTGQTLKASVHFRNTTTGEVTAIQELTLVSGGGQCASYQGIGDVVGMARGDGAASDWVSPSNALISSMSVIDNAGTRAVVLGVPKIWVKGL